MEPPNVLRPWVAPGRPKPIPPSNHAPASSGALGRAPFHHSASRRTIIQKVAARNITERCGVGPQVRPNLSVCPLLPMLTRKAYQKTAKPIQNGEPGGRFLILV
jgi:hypothetical protein